MFFCYYEMLKRAKSPVRLSKICCESIESGRFCAFLVLIDCYSNEKDSIVGFESSDVPCVCSVRLTAGSMNFTTGKNVISQTIISHFTALAKIIRCEYARVPSSCTKSRHLLVTSCSRDSRAFLSAPETTSINGVL